jgi:hypothetical protein
MINTSVLSISLAVIALYVSVRLAILGMTGNLERLRAYSIKKISDKNGDIPLLEFLKTLQSEQDVLLFEPDRSNRPIKLSFIIFFVIAILGTFCPNQYINDLSKNIYISIYSVSIGTMGYFLWYDFKYYEKYKILNDKYPVPENFDLSEIDNLIVRANKANAADARSRAAD